MSESPKVPLCRQNDCQLVVVDVQERLAGAMPVDVRTMVLKHAGSLISAAKLLDIPVLVTQQYPKGLGPIESTIQLDLPKNAKVYEKTRFSCCGADGFNEEVLSSHKRQVVLVGMEAHVCVLQTALELQSMDFEVFVVEDAVCSRDGRNHANAMKRLRQAGVVVTNMESVLFEWLRDSTHKHFKVISALMK